jgi:hypothetical protein
MLRPEVDRPVVGKKRNLLQLALTARINGDDEFVAGLDPDLRREILKVYSSFDEVANLVRAEDFQHLRDSIPRIVDELMLDGWSETAAGIVTQDYKDIPVTPRQFLTDPYYAGRFGEGLYPVNFRDACWLLNPKNRVFEVVLTGSTRWGKDQPLTSELITSDGLKKMGDITTNDLVAGRDGYFYPVTGVYPQGARDVYTVTFSDGQVVRCGAEHLWSVFTKSDKHYRRPLRTKTLRELSSDLHYRDGSNKWFVPVADPIQWSERHLLLHPYLAGVLIGNGGLTQNTPILTTSDRELLHWVAALLPPGVQANHKGRYTYSLSSGTRGGKSNPLMQALKALDMCHPAHEKRVPKDYLYGSVQQRAYLLQGLMDTDGSVEDSNNKLEYSTQSPRLAADVRFLVESLGGVCRYLVGPTAGRDRYRLRLALPSWLCPFQLTRKKNHYRPRARYAPSSAIVSVAHSGVEETQCISTSAPGGLYLTDHCVVTHNTTLATIMAGYRIYLLSLLRDPQGFFGLMHGSSIRYGIFNIFKYKTGDMHLRIQAIIDECPYFVEKFPRLSGERSKELILPDHVSIVEGATELHALGETFIGGILDEVNFMRSAKGRSRAHAEESLGQAQKLYGAIRGRLRNQFVASPGTAAPYFMCLLSQRRAQTDFLEEHITKHGHEDGVAVISRSIWDVQPEGTYKSGKTFRVFCGDDTAEPRILAEDEDEGDQVDEANVITAPLEHKPDAEHNIEDFIRNIAGRATVAASGLFHRPEVIYNNYDENLVHPFQTKSMVISTNSSVRIKDAVREDIMFETHLNHYRPRLHPEAGRVMHIDLAVTGCSVGIACVHMWTPPQGGMPLTYLDFAFRIDPPPYGRGEVDFDKIIEFVEYLHGNHYTFQMVSLDKYQSRHFVQKLHKMGIEADFVSVDESDDPYINLKGVYESGIIRTYPYEPLETELRHLSHDITAKKVFKPLNGSKDVSDALCGAVYGLIPPRKRANKLEMQQRLPVGGLPQAPAILVGG